MQKTQDRQPEFTKYYHQTNPDAKKRKNSIVVREDPPVDKHHQTI